MIAYVSEVGTLKVPGNSTQAFDGLSGTFFISITQAPFPLQNTAPYRDYLQSLQKPQPPPPLQMVTGGGASTPAL